MIAKVIAMEKKQRIFRITDQEHDALKAFLDKIRNKKAEDSKDSEAQEFLDKALVWFNSMKGLVAVGAIDNIPNPFKSQPVAESQPRQVFINDAADKTPGFGVSVNEFLSNAGTPQNISNTKQMFQKIAKQYNEYQQYPWVFSNAWEAVQQMPNPTAEDMCCAIEEQISCIDR